MEVESKPVNESGDNPGDKKEEMTSADYYFDRYVTISWDFREFRKILVFFGIFKSGLMVSENQGLKIFFWKNSDFLRCQSLKEPFLDSEVLWIRTQKLLEKGWDF